MDSKLIRDCCVFHLTYIAKKILVTYGSTLTAESEFTSKMAHNSQQEYEKSRERERPAHVL
jgi:hypothetical protein